ncbi:MAG: PHP domain-containing protein [Candidatus Omnitrophota bacterium]
MNGYADLHVHTAYSDGMFSPEKVVQKAVELELSAVAITDHDCVEGISPSIEAAAGTGLEIVPGVEISAAKGDTEIHILGYFIEWQDPSLLKTFKKMKQSRIDRMKKMLCLLRENGINISEEKVFLEVSEGTAGRLHLARVMVEENIVRDIKEAFDRYIGDGKSCHVKHERLDYRKAIEMIRKAGGVPVLAHPGTMGKDDDIPSFVQAGLKGIEVFHTKHRSGVNDKYFNLAKKYNLLITGGSDCHGMGPGKILIGKIKVGYEVVEDLRQEAEKIREEQARKKA